MEGRYDENLVTVQGVMTPVPAALGGARAGHQPSISSACNVTPVSLARVTDNATSNKQKEQNPFIRSNKMRRTPPTGSGPMTAPRADTQSMTVDYTVNPECDAFVALGEMIVDLMEFVKARNNVHHAIKEKVRAIRVTYNKVRDGRSIELKDNPETSNHAKVNNSRTDRDTQTSPQIWPKEKKAKRDRDESVETPRTKHAKRRKKQRSPGKNPAARLQEESTAGGSIICKDTPSESERRTTNESDKRRTKESKPESIWSTVKKKGNRRARKPKPDAMIISATGEVTYADILRKLRGDPNLKEISEEVSKVRRTRKGDLILEMKTSSGGVVERFTDKIQTTLVGCAEIKTRKEEQIIECKDMDDITTKSEICSALSNALEIAGLEENCVKSIRRTYGGTQSAKISLPVTVARRALEMGKLKIGWSICRLRETVTLLKCFRCLEYGHVSSSCKSEIDRSRQCRKCGAEGHISKNCEAEPNCILCRSSGNGDVGHVAGSFRCPVFKKALNTKSG